MAISQQLQAESAQQNNTSFSTSVTLGAGSDRLFLLGIAAERASLVAPTTGPTYGGVAMSLVTDGTQTASHIEGTFGGVHFYCLKEADLPADGSNTLAFAYSGGNVNYVAGWWIFEGVDQGNAVDVKVLGQSTTATSITVTLDAGASTDAVVCAAYKNGSDGTVAITISGAGVTEDFDVDLSTGGARGAAGTDLPAVASGTIACVATVNSTSRRVIVAIRLAEAAAVPVEVSGGFSTGAATTSGLLLTTQREVDGAVALPAVGLGAAMRLILEASGALQLGAVQVAGSLEVPIAISGDIELEPVEVTGSTEEFRAISGNVQLGAVQASGALEVIIHLSASIGLPVVTAGNLDVLTAISGGFELGAAQVAGDVERRVHISGAVQLAAVQAAGIAVHVRAISGGFLLPVVLAGELRTQFPGSCVLRDAPASSAELTHEAAGFATLQDGPAGTAEIGHA